MSAKFIDVQYIIDYKLLIFFVLSCVLNKYKLDKIIQLTISSRYTNETMLFFFLSFLVKQHHYIYTNIPIYYVYMIIRILLFLIALKMYCFHKFIIFKYIYLKYLNVKKKKILNPVYQRHILNFKLPINSQLISKNRK